MKLSTVIKTLTGKRAFLLRRMESAEIGEGRWHGMNQEQRALEVALPILEAELRYRHAQIAERAAETESVRFSTAANAA